MERDKALNIVEKWVNKVYDTQQAVINRLTKEVIDTEKVTRVEVIDDVGRSYVSWNPKNKVEISIQDEGKTMKIFITNK